MRRMVLASLLAVTACAPPIRDAAPTAPVLRESAGVPAVTARPPRPADRALTPPNDNWIEVGRSDSSVTFLNAPSLVQTRTGWTGWLMMNQLNNRAEDGVMSFRYQVEWDCSVRPPRNRPITGSRHGDINAMGRSISHTDFPNVAWRVAPPDSVGDRINQVVCGLRRR